MNYYTCCGNCFSEPFNDRTAEYYDRHNGSANLCDACADQLLAGGNAGYHQKEADQLRAEIRTARNQEK